MEDFVNSASALFGSPLKRRYKIVGPLPVNGLRFRIQSLSEGELSAYQAVAVGKEGFRPGRMEDANRRLIAKCLVDGDGNRLLTDGQAAKLAEWDAADATALYNECAQHVGVKREDVDDLAKNSDATAAASSPTG